MDFYAVIPTHNRPRELLNLVSQLVGQGVTGDRILVINNGNGVTPGVRETCRMIDDTDRDPHIYRMWNTGLKWAERRATIPGKCASQPPEPHAVAILNDDIQLPDNFVSKMAECLRETDVTIAFPGQGPGIVNQLPGNVCKRGCAGTCAVSRGCKTTKKRITGYAFVVNGTHGIRCDEQFKWWYGDDDLDWQARRDFNGTQEVSGVTVNHLYPSESTNASPVRLHQAERDRETFIKKWGKSPW